MKKGKKSSTYFSNEVNSICQPLFDKTRLNFFSFIRIFKDKKRICLTTRPDWSAHYIKEKFYLKDIFETVSYYPQDFLLWENINPEIQEVAKSNFNLQHGITIIRSNIGFNDFFHFGSKSDENFNLDYYLDFERCLKTFSLYFLEKGQTLIQTSPVVSYLELNIKKPHRTSHSKIAEHLSDAFSVKRFYINAKNYNQYITYRELQCFKWLINGKTADETAMILNISKRTVDVHYGNLKQKLGCSKLAQLAYKLALAGINDILDIA